ncbi:hypothetical protein PanWU01x14_337840 [Parasponia andersonii]|uniref:Transmembrane protein n=1 Tax=Parasponia andersonii TaxID=3476 RepID=A0A2P5AFE8_PARAD|nr:hypothetical protein PanWU01x14_337840 [Parasponia andersonii]
MALNLRATTSLYQNPSSCSSTPPSLIPKHYQLLFKLQSTTTSSSSFRTLARSSQGSETGTTEQEIPASFSGPVSTARSQLDLLEQLTSTSSSVDGYESDGSSGKLTIRDQLAQLVGDRAGDFSIPLGKNLKKVSAKFLTISQKRNIRRQAYMDEVSQRNDSVFFATIGAFVILPPVVILGIAILTGYVQLFP